MIFYYLFILPSFIKNHNNFHIFFTLFVIVSFHYFGTQKRSHTIHILSRKIIFISFSCILTSSTLVLMYYIRCVRLFSSFSVIFLNQLLNFYYLIKFTRSIFLLFCLFYFLSLVIVTILLAYTLSITSSG